MPSESLKNNTPNFSSIHWPVWIIRPHESISGGLITDKRGIRRLDLKENPTNAEFPVRRLQAKGLTDYPVYPLKKAIWSLKDLLSSGHLCFIDFEGKIYKYKKNDKERKLIAKKGKMKYLKYFNSTLVAEFIINKTYDIKKKYYWENSR